MKTPERIWIDEHGGNWSPVGGGTQQREYTPADLLTAAQAEIARLTAELEDWKAAATRHHPNPADHRYWEGRYRDEKACADKAELDAARYRWLRTRNLDAISAGGVFAGKTPENVVLNGDDLDAAIDLAMVAGDAGADDRLQLSPRFQKLYDQACARDALDAEQGLHQRLGLAATEATTREVAIDEAIGIATATLAQEAADHVGQARLLVDTGASQMGKTTNYRPWVIMKVLEHLDTALRAIAAIQQPARDKVAHLPEARGKLHDLMRLPKDADLEIARQWAKEAYDLLS